MYTNWRRTLVIVAVAALIAGVMFAGGCQLVKDLYPAKQGDEGGGLATAEQLPGVGPDAIADVVSQTSPAVVKISTRINTGASGNPFVDDPFFRQFFGLPQRQREQEGLGSGFIISADGYVLTNEHVVDGADEITVTVTGFDQDLPARVVGADYDLDLALLKLDAGKDLPFLPMGNSDQIRVGNWVIAIGNPYGLDHTVTTGVISAKGRPIAVNDRQYENLLQTDASINPGNSGGPLLNLRGEVVGINTAINAEAQGIGFAIPTSTVARVLEDLKNNVIAVRPWIGVQVRSVDEDAIRSLGLDKAEGALVVGVISGSPADKAGLRQGDVIMEFNANKIGNADDLVAAIKACQVNASVNALVVRKKELRSVSITIAEKPRNIN
ncbi:putative periplasmic serine endoprotease DegP-like precursor [Pelotomaculum schinkii]|uniref:Putative periplasmic serine endoprotease DegP-like n=1 Tax=Pelotomaculum schinkii TaxID=78350 RepID=A0A4Y7RA78_9FIRM|nr:trypsin-like peptidase domain-containing protein [Pelotomaculum schinkii]TEB05854.1 putative periplasmic serine endoprotease DegP-like precursor [Pelotomaculum schinkii]